MTDEQREAILDIHKQALSDLGLYVQEHDIAVKFDKPPSVTSVAEVFQDCRYLNGTIFYGPELVDSGRYGAEEIAGVVYHEVSHILLGEISHRIDTFVNSFVAQTSVKEYAIDTMSQFYERATERMARVIIKLRMALGFPELERLANVLKAKDTSSNVAH